MLAEAFEMLRHLENVDARHCFACCQTCGVHQMEALENTHDDIIGYCFYHAQDADGVLTRKQLYLSYGGYETPDGHWDAEEVARVVTTRLNDCGFVTEWDGDTDTRIRVILDAESVDYVSAWAEGFEGGRRVSYDWKYFDFEKSWDVFSRHWYTDEVQTILKGSIDRLEIDHDLHVGNPFVEDVFREPWRKGDALWQLSPNYYSYNRFSRELLEGPEQPHRAYNRAMKQINPRMCMTLEAFLDSTTGMRVMYHAAKQTRSIGSLVYTDDDERLDEVDEPDGANPYVCFVMCMPGRRLIHDALRKVAEMMFRDSTVAVIETPEESTVIAVVEENIVFDLIGYYFCRFENWAGTTVKDVADLFRLNQMKSGLDL